MRKLVIPIICGAIALYALGCGNNKKETIEAKSMEQLHKENGVPV